MGIPISNVMTANIRQQCAQRCIRNEEPRRSVPIIWDWTNEDQHAWATYEDGVQALYSVWIDKAVQAFAEDALMHTAVPEQQDPAVWFRGQLERHRSVFCSSPTDPKVRDASRRVGFAHIQSHVWPSWFVGLYNMLFDAYHTLEDRPDAPSLPPLGVVRRRWLAEIKTILDTYEVAMAGKVAALNDLALTDPLTGLLNRRGFWQRVAYDIDHGVRHAIFIIMDLDHFKRVNDTEGHPYGDRLLQQFAALAETHTRSGDALSRLGGDEFAWWVVNTTSIEPLQERLSSLAFALQTNCSMTFSAGLASYPLDGADVDPLYHTADAALYRAKHGGRQCYAIARDPQLYSFFR